MKDFIFYSIIILIKQAQAVVNIQNQCCIGSTDSICSADTFIGEVRRFCQLQAEGQSLMRAVISRLNLSRTIADPADSEEMPRLRTDGNVAVSPKNHGEVIFNS